MLWLNQFNHLSCVNLSELWNFVFIISKIYCCSLFSAFITSKAKVSFKLFAMTLSLMALSVISHEWDHKTISSDLSNSELQEEEIFDDKEVMEMSKISLNRKMRRRFSEISGGDEDSKRRRYKNRGIKFWLNYY